MLFFIAILGIKEFRRLTWQPNNEFVLYFYGTILSFWLGFDFGPCAFEIKYLT